MERYLRKVSLDTEIALPEFFKFTDNETKQAILDAALKLRGQKLIHVNATAEGGGVSELLRSLIPAFRALGLDSDWYVMDPSLGEDYFLVTNKIHNALQGGETSITPAEWNEYERIGELVANDLESLSGDILAINDPQPLLAGSYATGFAKKIYFSHIDTSRPQKPVWDKLLPRISVYDSLVFSNSDFVNDDLPKQKINVFTPAIDPLTKKQTLVDKVEARQYLSEQAGIPEDGPLIVQVSRFDVWKNPLGVLEAFRLIADEYPKAKLMLVGFNNAKDNPAASAVYQEVLAKAGDIKNVFLFFDPGTADIEEFTMMAQNAADVVVQNSKREGFGLTVTEAMWKGKPVIGGPASGIRKQIVDGQNGFIVDSRETLAEKIKFVLHSPEAAENLGKNARATVQEKFLLPRLVADHLRVYLD